MSQANYEKKPESDSSKTTREPFEKGAEKSKDQDLKKDSGMSGNQKVEKIPEE